MSEPAAQLERVRARRRIATRAGALLLVAASVAASACIFDKSDYQGGGRVDKGATANTAEEQPSASASSEPTDTSSAPTSNPLRDAGLRD